MKKKLILFATVFTFLSIESNAQIPETSLTHNSVVEEPPEKNVDSIYDVVEQSPEFPGGINKFNRFFYSNFHYPDDITETIRINISFVVEKDGTLSNIQLLKDPGHGIAEEVVRVLSKSPKWRPGISKGKSVKTIFRFPMVISFE